MFKVRIDGKEIKLEEKITLEELSKQLKLSNVYAATVNNRLRELTYYIENDADIEFLGLDAEESTRMYHSTLRYIMVMAVKRIAPNGVVKFTHSISRSFLCTIKGVKEDEEFIKRLDKEMKEIIASDYPIERHKMSKEEARKVYKKQKYFDKIDVLAYREEDTVNTYICNGYYNYMYGYMLPSTGYIKEFNLIPYFPGILVQYPRNEMGGAIPEFEDSPALSNTIKEAYKWSRTCKIENIASMNQFTEDRDFVDFVNMCETKHNNMLADLGRVIKKGIRNIKLIAIAGPSSSGKTTFSNRLRVELMTQGIFPILISIDNYYKDHSRTPLDENGDPDYEHLEAIDLDYFNKQLKELISGEEVTLPIYDFKTGTHRDGETVKLKKNQPIIIEGIHALNERLTAALPRKNKYKIYITPFPQINIDNHNPIIATDIRMLRRVVRDAQFRKTSAEETFKMWPSVRRGEFKWIYPFHDEADFTYNTELTYEIMVMKKYALPVLKAIDNNSEYFIKANRLIKFLKYIKDIEDKYVPCNSILREFIGGSCFYEK